MQFQSPVWPDRAHSWVCNCNDHAFKPTQSWGVVLVSPQDAKLLDTASWYQWRGPGKRTSYVMGKVAAKDTRLHRLILPNASTVDHINRNGLDNRRSNLRAVDKFQSAQNRSRQGKSGVVFKKGGWEVRCQAQGKRWHVGSFPDRAIAEAAYRGAVHALHGEYGDRALKGEGVKASQVWKPTEDQLHASIVAALRLMFRNAIVAHVPNEGWRSPSEAKRQADLGLVPGMPDLIVVLPEGRICFLEVKTATGRLSAVQAELHDRFQMLGHSVHVVRSIEDATAAVNRAIGRVIP